jgi:Concanavalin A-like lectin/glucanases superfamily
VSTTTGLGELTITVLNETKMVDGVETRVVEERETKGGKLKEVSRNYFAISKRTNDVFYFGEVTPAHGTAPLRIGTRDRKSFFLGAIHEVRIWRRALTAAEVDALYRGSVPQDGLVAEYLLRQDIALDSTGLSNGFIMGASWVPSSRDHT